jgi:hypothetical protein
VDSTLYLRIIKKAETICFTGDVSGPMLFYAACPDESVTWETQEHGDFFDLVVQDLYPAFAVAAGPASFAFERFHESAWSQEDMKSITKTRKKESTKKRKVVR